MESEQFMRIAQTLYNSEEYNKAVSELAFTKDKNKYAKNLLTVLKIEQKAIQSVKDADL